MVQVTLLRGTDLKPVRLKASPVESRDTEQCMCFVEMLALGRSYVGPIAAQGNSPEWDWTFFLPLDVMPTKSGAVSARFSVHDFMSRKQPQVRCDPPPTTPRPQLATDAGAQSEQVPHPWSVLPAVQLSCWLIKDENFPPSTLESACMWEMPGQG